MPNDQVKKASPSPQSLSGFKLYDESFYRRNKKTEYAASEIIKFLTEIFEIRSVTDVGCGRGAWLVACKKSGIIDIHGIDGHWNSQEQMLDKAIKFFQMDLSSALAYNLKRDLCISLEVAEHINSKSSASFIDGLCKIADVILFSGAYEGQGGVGHINEQKHSYWAKLFSQNNFDAYDLIRPRFWGDESMDFWYRQNIFLYIKRQSLSSNVAHEAGLTQVSNYSFMDAIHPELYKIKCNQTLSLGQIMKQFGPAIIASLKHRFNIG